MQKDLNYAGGRAKKTYESPKITVTILEMEQGIAAGSANVGSKCSDEDLLMQWETGADRDTNFEW